METSSDYSIILNALKEAGIKEEKLDKATSGSFLPEGENEFVGWSVKGESPFTHAVLHTKQGGVIAVSSLLASAHFGEAETAIFTKGTRQGAPSEGKYFLSGTRVNPLLPADQAKCIEMLMGKTITHSVTAAYILPFVGTSEKPDFASSEQEAKSRLALKTFFKIAFKDEPKGRAAKK